MRRIECQATTSSDTEIDAACLLLRVHPFIAPDGIYDSAAPKELSGHATPQQASFRIGTYYAHTLEKSASPLIR